MASATAASQAAITMTRSAKTWPPSAPSTNRENATRLMFAELKISSMDINTFTAFRRVSTPKTPSEKSAAEM